MAEQSIKSNTGDVDKAPTQSPSSLQELCFVKARYSPRFSLWKHLFCGSDEYWLGKLGKKTIVYGFLRGWYAKWDDICLGIIVHPKYRRQGYGEQTIRFLLNRAKQRGLRKLRLHVSPRNKPALRLYRKFGFKFSGKIRNDGELIGFKTL